MTEAERAAIVAAADRKERDRCRTILTSPDGVRVGALAHHIAFETAMRADEALPILAIARGAIDAAATGSEPEAWARATVPAEISIHSH
jgi:hypothetical protein